MATLKQDPLSFPWEMFMQAQDMKNNNQRNMYGDIYGMGQGLGQIGLDIQEYKKQQIVKQLVQAMKTQGAPQQGPPLAPMGTPQPNLSQIPPGQPMSAGGNIGQDVQMPQPIPTQGPGQPTSGMGGSSADNSQQMQALMMQIDPQGMIKSMIEQKDPYRQALTAQANAEAQAKLRPPKPSRDWAIEPGKVSKNGNSVFYDKATMEEKEGGVPVTDKSSDATDFKNTVRQDKLGKEYRDRVQRVVAARTGGLGLQDQKVDQAVHLRSMINQSFNPQTRTYELPEMQQGELVMGLANLVSGSSVSNIEQLKSITPKTARGDTAHLVSYWTGKPLTTQPQEMIKNLITSIDRQGQVSEKLRDKYVNGLKNLVPKGLDTEEADNIRNTELTSSFSDFLKESPDQGGSGGGLTPQEQAEFAALEKKYGGRR